MTGCHHVCRVCKAWSNPSRIKKRFVRFFSEGPGCWEWTGHCSSNGYGRFDVGGVPEYAHRVAVILDGRKIPDGMQVDHLCRSKSCVRPDHLQVVSPSENNARRDDHRIAKAYIYDMERGALL